VSGTIERGPRRVARLAAVVCALLLAVPAAAQDEEVVTIDGRGRVVRYRDAYGLETVFYYDALDRLYEIRSPRGQARIGHDATGRHAWTKDDVGIVRYDYDAADRLVGTRYEVRKGDERVFAAAVKYEYDDHGKVSRVAMAHETQGAVYAVDLERNAKGEIEKVRIAGHEVSYDRSHRTDGATIVRTLPDGTRSVLRSTAVGLTTRIEHFKAGSVSPDYEVSLRYDLAEGQVVLSERTGARSQAHTVEFDPPAGVAPVVPDLTFSADGRMVEQRIDGRQCWFLNAPTGPESGLVVEIDGGGRPARAFYCAPDLSAEQCLGEPLRIHLEDGRTPSTAPLDTRLLTGRPLAQEAEDAAFSKAHGFDAWLRREAKPWLPRIKRAHKIVRFIMKAGKVASEHYQPNMDDGIFDGKLAPKITLALGEDYLEWRESPQTSFWQKVWHHGILGNTAEALTKDYSKRFFTRSMGKGIGSETVGILFDVMRGHDALSPEVAEHLADIGFALVVGGMASRYPPTKAIAPQIMDLAVDVPGLFRTKALQQWFEEQGRRAGATGRGRTGQFIYDGAATLLRGDMATFWKLHGDLFDTVASKSRRHRSAFVTRRNRSFAAFQDALRAGDRTRVAGMLRNDAHVRRAVMEANYTAGHLEQMADALTQPRPPKPVSRAGTLEAQRALGGVDLAIPAAMLPALGRIEGAVFDPKTGRILLVGDGDVRTPPLDPDFLALALVAVAEGRDLKFSLDPVDPGDPASWQKAKYIPEDLMRGSRGGQAAYEADLDLKLIAFGCAVSYGSAQRVPEGGLRVRGPVELRLSNRWRPLHLGPRAPMWPGFASLAERAQRAGGGQPVRSRQWIVVRDVLLAETAHAFAFEQVVIGVNARRQEISSTGELVDVDADDPISTGFARQMSENFDRVAERVPSFRRIREFAKAVAFAKWLARSGVDVDLAWARDRLSRRVDCVREVSTLHWVHERGRQLLHGERGGWGVRTSTHRVHVSGGVDLAVAPKTKPDRVRVPGLREATLAAARSGAPAFRVPFRGRRYAAAVLPMNAAGHRAWAGHRRWERGGIEYTVNGAGRIASARDALGGRESYEWSRDGSLRAVTAATPNGWVVRRTPREEERTTPNGQRIRWRRLPGGAAELSLDGEVECVVRQDGTRVHVAYPKTGVVRTIELDEAGRVVALHRKTRHGPGETVRAEELSKPRTPRLAGLAIEAPDPRTVTVSFQGLKSKLDYDEAGLLVRADLGPLASVRRDLDPETGLGTVAIGDRRIRIVRIRDTVPRDTVPDTRQQTSDQSGWSDESGSSALVWILGTIVLGVLVGWFYFRYR